MFDIGSTLPSIQEIGLTNDDGFYVTNLATDLLISQFDATDRIDSIVVERQDDNIVLIVNANMGNVGSSTCEFVWKL